MTILFRLLYRLQRMVSWVNYRTRRRFTKAGLVVGGAMIVSAMMSPDTDNNLAYQIFTLSFATLAVAIVYCWRLRGTFAVERHLPRFGTVGRPLTYSVTVTNNSKRPQVAVTLLETLVDPRPSFPDWLAVQRVEERELSFRFGKRFGRPSRYKLAEIKEAALPPLPPGQEAQTRIELTPLRRGILRFTGTTLARTDPLGLCRAFHQVALPQTTVILPKRYALPQIAFPGSMQYQQGGVAMASHVGQSEEFVSLRDYRYGDPIRHIHWRTWARLGKPVVKEFEDEFFVRHALVLDTFVKPRHSEAFEEAVSLAASFACTLDTQDSLLDLLFVGPQAFCFTAGRGLAHADQMLEILASVKPCHQHPFSHLENLVVEHSASVSGCVCILLLWDEQRRAFLRKLETAGVPLVVFLVLERGAKAPAPSEDQPERFFVVEAGDIERGLAKLK